MPAAAQAAPPNVTPDPLFINFGQQSVDLQTPNTTITFQNLSGADIEVIGFSISGADVSQFQVGGNGCNPQTLNFGNSCNVDVFFRPGSVGSFSASADLTTDEGVESVPLTGEGASGSLSGTAPTYTPQPFYFGNQFGSAQFQNTDQNFTVMSMNATITGPDAALFSVGNNGCGNQQTLFPNNSCNVDVFFNPTGPGTRNAQLNLFNSGSPNPATVALSATALAGPKAVVTPGTIDFGNVGVGSSSPVSEITIENQGDSVLQIQQLFVISGAPNFFPLTDNQCSDGVVVAPGASCTLNAAFAPGKSGTGPQNGSIFVIANLPGPFPQSFLSGTGYEQPGGGHLTIEGNPMAHRTLTCQSGGFPAGTNLAYRWVRGGKQVATGRTYRVADRDIGVRLTCAVTASNPVGSADIASPASAVVTPAYLGRMGGSLVGGRLCRALQAPAAVGGARLEYGRPVTPRDPLRITGRGQITVSLDGERLARGGSPVVVTPRQLDDFGDGEHSLSVTNGGKKSKALITLTACELSAGSVIRGGSAVIKASSSTGMGPLTIRAGSGTRFFPRRLSGQIAFKTLDEPREAFLLSGGTSRSNGVSVRVSGKAIRINGLPQNAGVVRLNLHRGSVNGGRFAVKAQLKGAGNRTVRVIAARQR